MPLILLLIYFIGDTFNFEDSLITERIWSQEEIIEDTFKRRKRIYDHSCSILPFIQEILQSNETTFETLLDLHRQIFNLKIPTQENFQKTTCIANNIRKSSVFNLTKTMDLMICLPPKCGTSNWQKALDVHFINLTKSEEEASLLAEKIAENKLGEKVYSMLPRANPSRLYQFTKAKKNLTSLISASNRVANSRDSFIFLQ